MIVQGYARWASEGRFSLGVLEIPHSPCPASRFPLGAARRVPTRFDPVQSPVPMWEDIRSGGRRGLKKKIHFVGGGALRAALPKRRSPFVGKAARGHASQETRRQVGRRVATLP